MSDLQMCGVIGMSCIILLALLAVCPRDVSQADEDEQEYWRQKGKVAGMDE